MDILPSGNIFRELQIIHETGCFSSESSIEEQWQQLISSRTGGFPTRHRLRAESWKESSRVFSAGLLVVTVPGKETRRAFLPEG
ncbi:hypothetical protein quinque_003680 [Culex quinquefasciatus]